MDGLLAKHSFRNMPFCANYDCGRLAIKRRSTYKLIISGAVQRWNDVFRGSLNVYIVHLDCLGCRTNVTHSPGSILLTGIDERGRLKIGSQFEGFLRRAAGVRKYAAERAAEPIFHVALVRIAIQCLNDPVQRRAEHEECMGRQRKFCL